MTQQLTLGLEEIAERIHTVWAETKAHQIGAWEGYFAVGHLLQQSRDRLPGDREFGRWFAAQEFGFNRAWSARLMRIANNEATVRQLLLDSALSSKKGELPGVDAMVKMLRFEEAADRPPIEWPAAVDCRLEVGDFTKVLGDIPDGSLDLILTDPPYPEEFLPLWSDLAKFAKAKLAPYGMLAAMSGQFHLPTVYKNLGDHLSYRWTMAYLTPGAYTAIHARGVISMWKPVLVYQPDHQPNDRRIYDVATSKAEDKEFHEWGQSESGMFDLLQQLADPGATVCDPFMGGGTTGVVAAAHGCHFIGAEIDPDMFEKAKRRLGQ